MTSTSDIAPGEVFDLSAHVVGIDRTSRRAAFVAQQAGRPPRRIDGLTIGAPAVTADAPHNGEVHPDGDELLYLVSGAMSLLLEMPDGDVEVELRTGDAVVLPKGVWHKLTLREACQLLHITPGPNGDARPLRPTPDRVSAVVEDPR